MNTMKRTEMSSVLRKKGHMPLYGKKLGQMLQCFDFFQIRKKDMRLLFPKARNHLLLCLEPIGMCLDEHMMSLLGQPYQSSTPVTPRFNNDQPLVLKRFQSAGERTSIHGFLQC